MLASPPFPRESATSAREGGPGGPWQRPRSSRRSGAGTSCRSATTAARCSTSTGTCCRTAPRRRSRCCASAASRRACPPARSPRPITTCRRTAAISRTSAIPNRRAWRPRSRTTRAKSGIRMFGIDDPRQGIIHVIGPEQGLTQPGLLIVCGDSHTSTHGALGALAFGIGASEVAHVLATQTIWQKRPKTMRITVEGALGPGVTAKDIILAIIAKIGAAGATGHAIEYAGPTVRAPVDGRPLHALQHVDRGRRARGHDRARRHHVRLSARPPVRARGRGLGTGRARLAHAAHRRRRDVRPRGHARRVAARADGHLGQQPRGRAADQRPRARSARRRRRRAARRDGARR